MKQLYGFVAHDAIGNEFVGANYESAHAAELAVKSLVRQGFVQGGSWRVVEQMPRNERSGDG